MAFFVVYEATTGKAVSMGTIVANPLPAGLASKEFVGPPTDQQEWDASTLGFRARPPYTMVDRVADLLNDPDYLSIVSGLTPMQRDKLKTVAIKLLGDRRYRHPEESMTVG